MTEHRNPQSHRDIGSRTTGKGVAAEGDDRGSRPQGDEPAIAWNDKRYYSTDLDMPRVRVRAGAATDADGYPIYSSDMETER